MSLYPLQKPLFMILVVSWIAVTGLFIQHMNLRMMVFYCLIFIVYAALVQIVWGIEKTDRLPI